MHSVPHLCAPLVKNWGYNAVKMFLVFLLMDILSEIPKEWWHDWLTLMTIKKKKKKTVGEQSPVTSSAVNSDTIHALPFLMHVFNHTPHFYNFYPPPPSRVASKVPMEKALAMGVLWTPFLLWLKCSFVPGDGILLINEKNGSTKAINWSNLTVFNRNKTLRKK